MRCKSTLATAALIVLAAAGPAVPPAFAQTGPQPRLETVKLQAGMHLITAEVAQTPTQQATGMMFRTSMGANEAMLFVDSQSSVRCFWMRNTLIPLAIAFIQDDGTIVNIAEMQPRSDESHCSKAPVRYALEMNTGWFAKRGIKAGSRIVGGPFGK
jgi:uncharacterized protein